MVKDIAVEALEKYRDILLNEKDKTVCLKVEQLNALHDDITRLENENEALRLKSEKFEEKYNEQLHKARSWCSKYNYISNKTYGEIKDEVYNEIKQEQEERLRKNLEAEYEHKLARFKFDLEKNYLESINEEVDSRIQKLSEIKEEFSSRLSKEKDRYEQEYDLENERNQGYLIGIAKTRKVMLEVFDEKLKPNPKRNLNKLSDF